MNSQSTGRPWAATLSVAERARIARITREGWRELGFWCECDYPGRQWKFRSDRNGLRGLARAIRDFLGNPAEGEPGDHLHLGPFANLRIIRADGAVISWRGIGGTPADLETFVAELEALAASGEQGTRELCAAFTHDDGFRVVVQSELDGFDPASADLTLVGDPEA